LTHANNQHGENGDEVKHKQKITLLTDSWAAGFHCLPKSAKNATNIVSGKP